LKFSLLFSIFKFDFKNPENMNNLIERLHALSHAALALNSSLNLDDILARNLKILLDVLNADRGTIYLVDKEKSEIWSKVLTGDGMREIRLPIGVGLAGHVAQTGETLIIPDVYEDPRFNKEYDLKTNYRTKSMLVMPIRNQKREVIGVFQVINKLDGVFTALDAEFSNSLAEIAGVAFENALLHQRSLKAVLLEKELDIARDIQQRIIPKILPVVPGYEFSLKYQACSEVGGDYVDVISVPGGKTAFLMADVSGHGIPASLLVSTIQATIRAYMETGVDFSGLAERINRTVFANSTEDTYATLFFAVLDPENHEIQFFNAGHPAPVHVGDKVGIPDLGSSGPPVGMFSSFDYETRVMKLKPGEYLFLYTDGITETFNSADDMFGDDGLENTLRDQIHLLGNEAIELAWTTVHAWDGRDDSDDDRAVLVVKRNLID